MDHLDVFIKHLMCKYTIFMLHAVTERPTSAYNQLLIKLNEKSNGKQDINKADETTWGLSSILGSFNGENIFFFLVIN